MAVLSMSHKLLTVNPESKSCRKNTKMTPAKMLIMMRMITKVAASCWAGLKMAMSRSLVVESITTL